MEMVYFDNSATTKPLREVIEEVAQSMECCFANPSSAHRLGLEAEKRLRAARERVAALVGAQPQEIVFTSGGSEANNTAILGTVSRGDHIITTAIEHPSVLELLRSLEGEGIEVTYLGVDEAGRISLRELGEAIKENTRLVAIMHVNNEIGSIQPIGEISRIVRERSKKAKLHVDAVQSAGKLRLNVRAMDVDMLSISAHKLHGPKGAGALYIKKGLRPKPLIAGGGQESNFRSGTENLPGISGFGRAAEAAARELDSRAAAVRLVKAHFIERLSELEGVHINSPLDGQHIDHILNVSFEGVRGEVLLHALEDYNIFVSTGSACSARNSGKNYVLPAIGLKEKLVEGALRFSFSYMNTIAEADYTIEALKKILPFLRRLKK